jgi:hypothetical protein
VPVEVDLHLMPQAESFALARPVNWRHGDPFVLSNFVYAGNPRWHVPAHELYHVLAIRWEIGAKARDATQLNLANAMEEIAAQLFELCGRLLAGGEAAPIANSNTINVNDRRIGNPPSAEEIGLLLSVLERLDQEPQLPDASPPGALFGATLANAYLQLVLGAGDVIREGSPQAESLLAACRRNLPDPLRIEDELRALVPPR